MGIRLRVTRRFPGSIEALRLVICAALAALWGLGAAAQESRTTWQDYGGGLDNSHYSALKQVTQENVNQLKVAWVYSTHDGLPYVFNPIVVDGVMYVLGRDHSLVAIDAATGKELWIHAELNGISQRGITYWASEDKKDRRLIFAIHQQLQEIDAATGKSVETFGTNGYVNLRTGLRRPDGEIRMIQSGTPGKVVGNLIIVGSSTGEGYFSPPGDIRAYDVRTGQLAWQFHTVPHPGELGYDTWPKDAWLYIGGTNVWGEFSVDEKRGIAYFPVGSPTYDYYGADRKGNDLFSDCLLALDARTGKYLWHFQEVHHDLWDYDPTAAPQLTTVQIDGKSIDVVAHAGKTGFLYVLDRVTGKPIWPIEEKSVPQTDVPGEQISPTQPFPTKPAAFSRQTFSEKDVNPYVLTPEERQKVKKQVADARNEGMFTPPSAKRDTLMMPGDRGGANWGMTAANPTNGMVFVAGINAPAVLHLYTEEPASLGFGLVRQGGPPGGQVYQQHCQMCHGANREGSIGPSLVDITKRVSPAIVRSTIVNGKGEMPPFTTLSETDIASLVSFLDDPSGAGGVKFDFSALMPKATKVEGDTPGPVVASGGAPAGKLDPDMKIPPIGPWGMMGGPPYPKGVAAPPARYYSAWNVMYKWANPPWTTLTAYDLNNGTIKWQIPVGEDAGAKKEGAKDTGALEEQRGPIVTAAGIVFMATVDGKVRAYDEQTGATLWVGLLPGGSKAIPAMYELNGRQYLVVNATWPLAAPGGDSNAAGTTAPTGYVAFALPETK